MHVSMILDPDTCMYDAYIFDLLPLALMHVCMMHTSIILDPDTCVYDACLYDGQGDSRSRMHIFMIRHICQAWTNLDSDAYIHDACMHDAYIYAP